MPDTTESGSSSDSSTQQPEPSPSNNPSQIPSCAHCHSSPSNVSSSSEESTLKPCISCKSVSYCSRDCKKADIKSHKKVCAKMAQEYFKTADVKMASRAPPKADTHRGGLQKWQFDT